MLGAMKRRHIIRSVAVIALGGVVALGIYLIGQSRTSEERTYTFAQVQAADRFHQCLILMGNTVYDIAPSVAEVPQLQVLCGTDATTRVEQLGIRTEEAFRKYRVGSLVQ